MRRLLYQLASWLLGRRWILKVVIRFLSPQKRERVQIAILRAEFAMWGYDTSRLTDEEILEGIKRTHEAMKMSCFTMEEAAAAFKSLAQSAGVTAKEIRDSAKRNKQ